MLILFLISSTSLAGMLLLTRGYSLNLRRSGLCLESTQALVSLATCNTVSLLKSHFDRFREMEIGSCSKKLRMVSAFKAWKWQPVKSRSSSSRVAMPRKHWKSEQNEIDEMRVLLRNGYSLNLSSHLIRSEQVLRASTSDSMQMSSSPLPDKSSLTMSSLILDIGLIRFKQSASDNDLSFEVFRLSFLRRSSTSRLSLILRKASEGRSWLNSRFSEARLPRLMRLRQVWTTPSGLVSVLRECGVQVYVHVDELGLEQRGEVDELVDHFVREALAA